MIGALKSKLQGLTAASLTDSVGRLCAHRASIPDLISPTPGRVLFGRAVTIRYVPFRQDLSDEENPSFSRFFYEAVTGDFEEAVLVLNNPSHRSEERRLGKACVRTCRTWGAPTQ